jgi:hypothetical protein
MESYQTPPQNPMNQVNLLRETLKPHLGWHGARLNFLALFLIALIRVKTINLTQLATGFRSDAQIDSSYKRLQRFFRDFNLDYSVIAQVVVSLMQIPQPWVLSVDRSEWSFGQTRLNIFMLGIVHQGVAYPVVWTLLPKKGNSNMSERIDLLERFRQMFPTAEIAFLCGDREFIGDKWLSYLLLASKIPFRLRIRAHDLLSYGRSSRRVSVCFAHLLPGQSQVLTHRRRIWGFDVFVAALRLDDGELLVVITPDEPQTAISDYAQRWGIETLFGIFKTRGFCLESTHFKDAERLSKLLALMTLALCWTLKTGQWLHAHTPIKIKKHGRLAQSIFRYGLDYLRSVFVDLDLNRSEFLLSLQFLSCT